MNRLARVWAAWPWLLAAIPPLLLLGLILRLRIPIPYLDSWAFIEQYLHWANGTFAWGDWFLKHGAHPSAVGKVVYFTVLHAWNSVGPMPLFNWLLSLVVAVCVAWLARPVWAGSQWLGGLLMFAAGMILFNAAQGGVWLWDFTFQNYIPGTCLALGLVLLATNRPGLWREGLAAVLAVVATFSFASGFLAGLLLTPFIWRRRAGSSTVTRVLASTGWVLGCLAAAAVALKGFEPAGFTTEGPEVGLGLLLDRPVLRCRFVLVLLGQMLGQGTAMEPFTLSALVGGALVLAGAAALGVIVVRRRDEALVAAAWPWVIFAAYGIGQAVLISLGRMGRSSEAFQAFGNVEALADRAMGERFITMTLFFHIGVLMLVALALRQPFPARVAGALRLAGASALSGLVLLQSLAWAEGENLMHLENRLMQQERAMLGFGILFRLDGNRLWNRPLKYHTVDFAKALSEMGRLPGVVWEKDASVAAFPRGAGLSPKWASLGPIEPLAGGAIRLDGACGIESTSMDALPDLVLVSAQPTGGEERLVGLAAPYLPERFLERQSQRRRYPLHYYGWSLTLKPADLPAGRLTLRAYGFDTGSRKLLPLPGERVFREGPSS